MGLLILVSHWQNDFPHSTHHREIAISISSYTLRHGDAGLVIVGGRMELQPHVCFFFFPFFFCNVVHRKVNRLTH